MGYPLGVGCYVIAASLTKIAHVAFICALPLTAVWAMILFRERPRAVQVVGLVLSVVGLFTISLRDTSDLLSWGAGELFALASAVGFSFALVSRRLHSADCDNKLLSSGFNLSGFMWLFSFSILNGEPLTFSPEPQTIVILILAGLVVALLTVAQSYIFTNVSGFLAGSVLSLESVFALILAWFIYDEMPTSRHLLGGAIILLGAILVVWSQRTSSS
jgi:drug/metabolite transporter (DMT)-like permease